MLELFGTIENDTALFFDKRGIDSLWVRKNKEERWLSY